MKTLYIHNERKAFIKYIFRLLLSTFLFGVFAWIGVKYKMPLPILVPLVLIAFLPVGLIVRECRNYMHYPYLFKVDENGLSTYLLTNQELLIPWETISSIKTFKTIQVVKTIRGRGALPARISTHLFYLTTLEIAVWDRDFLATYEDQATRLLKNSIECHPLRENNPQRWTVKIPCVLPFVESDLKPIIEQMEQFRHLATNTTHRCLS